MNSGGIDTGYSYPTFRVLYTVENVKGAIVYKEMNVVGKGVDNVKEFVYIIECGGKVTDIKCELIRGD